MKTKGKTLRASAIIEISVVFPMILFAIITLVIVVVFCYLQCRLKLEGERELFASEARGERIINLNYDNYRSELGEIYGSTDQISQVVTLFSTQRTFSSQEMVNVDKKKGMMMTNYSVYNQSLYRSNFKERYELLLLSRSIARIETG